MEAVPLPTCWLIRVVVFECACNGFASDHLIICFEFEAGLSIV